MLCKCKPSKEWTVMSLLSRPYLSFRQTMFSKSNRSPKFCAGMDNRPYTPWNVITVWAFYLSSFLSYRNSLILIPESTLGHLVHASCPRVRISKINHSIRSEKSWSGWLLVISCSRSFKVIQTSECPMYKVKINVLFCIVGSMCFSKYGLWNHSLCQHGIWTCHEWDWTRLKLHENIRIMCKTDIDLRSLQCFLSFEPASFFRNHPPKLSISPKNLTASGLFKRLSWKKHVQKLLSGIWDFEFEIGCWLFLEWKWFRQRSQKVIFSWVCFCSASLRLWQHRAAWPWLCKSKKYFNVLPDLEDGY